MSTNNNNNKQEELLYNQDDVDAILEKLRRAQRDAELSNQLLWAVVEAVGGEVSVPLIAWVVGMPEGKLEFQDHPETSTMSLRVVEEE